MAEKSLAEKYPDLFCQRCERLGSQCSCAEDTDHSDGGGGV